ncbi:sigma-70 family RNA polymerase sigma factor [Enterococcus dongliensis]|uniref:Sigma-70 family RNA polymerase sigma factor n=1 Tax=Enterococcus dongliensis TaxID=2559925 RepID=A0AAP5NN31_9ENTE|nr:sigma-70 family RNA polymerase sigma factor [Enterococcus dongliensis]MDT2597928.1 sigma-70 family RNA polymerase sigma factor [Enterococcus dongliensis]MDT2604894.1 sigma-70 family RNA polymerase sigma factor [Enterococcus dongliensis]MDT2635846.1 sigma-70 family RNA polymerase sigma factor [Enterococcus dongliensis]MDT2638377.1 sigma-70 family RNA polymerase sigma factor [Enterococcus dongliensis]MDT2643613.1 sigma-70 family RNA polymerase sigma factor [Enterococcus dongliensis]
MRTESAEELVQKYEPLFHKVLRSCGIFYHNPEYEDYLQIIRISFFERSQKLDLAQGDQLTLMYRFLCWRVRDYQRKQKNQQTLIEKVMRYDLDQEVSLEDRVLWEDFLARLWPKLSLGERRFLFARLCLGLSMNQITQAYKVSRSTVLNWKRRLAKRFS